MQSLNQMIFLLMPIFMSLIDEKSFWTWTIMLFISRIGASFVEISSESYFFKHVNQESTDIISFFRVMRPIAFIVAPIVATVSLQLIPFQYLFIVFGTFAVIGTKYAMSLKDTK